MRPAEIRDGGERVLAPASAILSVGLPVKRRIRIGLVASSRREGGDGLVPLSGIQFA